jgi:Spy/CpxP family protein refolding chaperone
MRTARVLISLLTIVVIGSSTYAQDAQPGNRPPDRGRQRGEGPGPRAMQPMPIERARAAWEAQARVVAETLKLESHAAGGLTQAYVDARARHRQADEDLRAQIAAKREEGESGREAIGELRQKLLELNRTAPEELRKTLGALLSEEQTNKAMASLGLFSRQWDLMADAILGFHLDGEKTSRAMAATLEFIEATGRGRTPRQDGREPPARPTDARAKLDEALKSILTGEQFEKFREATSPRRAEGGPSRNEPPGKRDDGKK